jgi:hypothetical protein
MSPLSMKRNILAEHLKEVIDTMELKVCRFLPFRAQMTDATHISGQSSRKTNRSVTGQRQSIYRSCHQSCSSVKGSNECSRDGADCPTRSWKIHRLYTSSETTSGARCSLISASIVAMFNVNDSLYDLHAFQVILCTLMLMLMAMHFR